MPTYQKRGPLYRYQAQGTQWALPEPTPVWWWPYRWKIVGSAIVCSLAVVVAGFVLGVVVGGADTAMPTARAAALRAEPVPVSGTASITIARGE